MNRIKLYIVGPPKLGRKYEVDDGLGKGKGIYCLIAETGEELYNCYCSDIKFAKNDLLDSKPERKQNLRNRFGNYQVLYLGDDEITFEELARLDLERFEKDGAN